MKELILLVEDEEDVAYFVKRTLERQGFAVELALAGDAALEKIEVKPPDLILLDLMLPDVDGLEVCRQVRARADYIPIIMLTAVGEEIDKVVGLELGADDYLTKPFSPRELVARIRAVLRLARTPRGAVEGPERLVIDERLLIDRARRMVLLDGQPVDLTPKEFHLLEFMATHRGIVFGRDEILERVWGYDYGGNSRTVDVHMQRLRSKLEPDAKNPCYLLTVRAIGYKFSEAN